MGVVLIRHREVQEARVGAREKELSRENWQNDVGQMYVLFLL